MSKAKEIDAQPPQAQVVTATGTVVKTTSQQVKIVEATKVHTQENKGKVELKALQAKYPEKR